MSGNHAGLESVAVIARFIPYVALLCIPGIVYIIFVFRKEIKRYFSNGCF